MPAPIPKNEEKRLAALREYRLLDSAPEQVYDDFTKIAAYIFDTPIATITMIDEHRQWFKSKVGVEHSEDPREISFCAHAIDQDGLFLINDATKDERFATNPLVTQDAGIRFYAGAPLVNLDGFALGTLCVIDHKPRELTEAQQEILSALARRVVSQIEFRRVSHQLVESLEVLKKAGPLMPICAHCKGIRSDSGYWDTIEHYLRSTNKMNLSHGICPTCVERFYPKSELEKAAKEAENKP